MTEYDPDDFIDPGDHRLYNANQVRTLIEVGISTSRFTDNMATPEEELAAHIMDIAKTSSRMRHET